MQRYFAKEKVDNKFVLYDSDLHHIKNVMRYQVGDMIEIIYENTLYICKITNIDPLLLEIIEVIQEDRNLNVNLTIAVSLVNEQKMDLILQKLTELGVSRIIPIKTVRSIVKLDEKKESKKIIRWQMICKEASEQAKRTDIPIVDSIKSLKDLLLLQSDLKLLCSLKEKPISIKEYLKKNIKNIMFVIGPEGGFTEQEELLLLGNGFNSVNLGKRVMRVETAAIYIASIINYTYEG